MVQRVVLALVVLLASLSVSAQKDKVNVCHFPDEGGVQLLSIARSALPAHLAHGDVTAPPSVHTAADCLIPQPPPEPVATTATTDADGRASFVIPSTNVIARVAVTDENGAPVPGATVQIIVIGDDYLLIAGNGTLGSAFAEGKLSDAQPGSALSFFKILIMHAYHTGFPAGGGFQATNLNFPVFVTTHFTTTDRCMTQDEFHFYVSGSWATPLALGAHVIAGGSLLGLLATTIVDIPIDDAAEAASEHFTAHMFAGKTLPMRTRIYGAPPVLGLQLVPFFYEDLGPCGGGCCVALGQQCELVSDAASCIGKYSPGVPCTPNPCKTGACCDAAFGCSIMTEGDCLALGRTYKGDDTTCSPNPCSFGACCSPAGCIEMPQYLCPAINGTFHGNGSSCTQSGNRLPTSFTLTSSRDTGGAGVPVPFPGGHIRTTITIPSNMIRGSGTTGDCGRGDTRVELRLCPPNAGCSGVTWYGGYQIAICHDFTETLTFEMLNNGGACASFSFNAITEKTSTAVIEFPPTHPGTTRGLRRAGTAGSAD